MNADAYELEVPNGFGLIRRTSRLSVDATFGSFLAAQITDLNKKDLGANVLDHVIGTLFRAPPDGLVAEFGVYRGDSLNRMAAGLAPHPVHGFDSFEGLPEDWFSGFSKGTFGERGELPQVAENAFLHKGWFSDTLPQFLADHPGESFALLHIDSDLYSSCKTVLELCSDRIRPGTVVVFDEIHNHVEFYLAEMRALYEFVTDANRQFEWIGFGYDAGCALRMPGWYGALLGTGIRIASWMSLRKPGIKVAAAVRFLT
jgi:hypothetical protein